MKFIKEYKLFENPNYIKYKEKKVEHTAENNVTFGYFDNKFEFIINDFGDVAFTHLNLMRNVNDVYNRNYRNYRTEKSGRLFVDDKIISFWHFPKDNNELKAVCDDIKLSVGIDCWNDEWKIELNLNNSDAYDKDTGYWTGYSETAFIPIKDYISSDNRSEEELKSTHTDSPMKKDRSPSNIHKNKNLQWGGYLRQESKIYNFDEYKKSDI